MARFSTDVTGKFRSCLFVLSALWEQGPLVAQLVLEKVQSSLKEGGEPPPFLAQILALGQYLKAALDLMVEIDRKLYDERELKTTLRAARDNDVVQLAKRTVGLRRMAEGCYAKPDLEKLGFAGRISREPVTLLRQSELVCERTQGENVEQLLGDSMFDPPIDLRPYAKQVEPFIEVVRGSFEAHHRSQRRVDQLLEEKKEAVAAYDVTFLRVARQFEDLCRLAGKNDLADKVRPSIKRPGEPFFLARYFDLCDGKALEAPWAAQDYVDVAVELARRTGDRHQIHRAAGVAAHALIAGEEWQRAAAALEDYRQQALECCGACAGDWLRRFGDLVVETSDPRAAESLLELSEQVLGDGLDDDLRGRVLFLRGIAHHFLSDCARALEAAGEALALLSLSSPRGYFLDAVAFLACFVEYNEERRYDEQALALLGRFHERLKGLRRWSEVRDRVHWVEGQLHGRLGHPKRARRRLQRARKGHVKRAPHHWALAVAIDEALLYAQRGLDEFNHQPVRTVILFCDNELRLDAELGGRLAKLWELLKGHPSGSATYLSQFRRSFRVPVPGLLVDLGAPGALDRGWAHGTKTPGDLDILWDCPP